MSELITTIQRVLKSTDLVLGWKLSDTAGVAVPAFFHDLEEAEAAVFDSSCVHNLAVYLPRLQERSVGIVAKGCDARSILQLITEGAVKRGNIRVVGVPCPGMVDVKKVWRCFGFGNKLKDKGGLVEMEKKTAPREEMLLAKCRGCRDIVPVICDESVGELQSAEAPPPAAPAGLKERFALLRPSERREFWRQQFSRCVRCYACREACPLCFCRDVCTMQTRDPHWVGGESWSAESEMAQQIRISHLAGRCTGCGECERACPVGIPLMLLLEEQNRAIEDMFGYRAGTELNLKPPLLTFDVDKDDWGQGR